MNIYFNTPEAFNISTIISFAALAVSLGSIYFQFFWKKSKLILHVHHDLYDFSSDQSIRKRDIAKNKISLSNSGNTTILLISINYRTIDLSNTISTYETVLDPNKLPILIKPGETILYEVLSKEDLFLDVIKNSERTNYDAFKFNVYLKFTTVINGKSTGHQTLLHKTQYYNPQKVHHQYSEGKDPINLLDKKYLLQV